MRILLQLAAILVLAVFVAILAVERPGEGEEKKQQAINLLKKILEPLKLPTWLLRDDFLGAVINGFVWLLNTLGWAKAITLPMEWLKDLLATSDPQAAPGG